MKNLLKAISVIMILTLIGSCTQKKVYRIGISQCSSDDWRTKMNEEVMLEALLHDDVEVEIRSAHDDSQKQINDIEYFLKKGVDVIVVAPNEAHALTPEIKKVYDKGIPVIIFDRNINGDSYTQRIGVDNVGLGASAGRYAVNLQTKVEAIEIYGLPGSTPAIERSIGFSQVFDSLGGILLASAPGNWQQEKGRLVADSLLRVFPQTNLIFAHNDRMAIGAAEAAKALNRNDIKIIGIDAAPEIGIQAVNDGVITATFLYPTEGHQILREAIKIAKGEPFERELMLPTTSAVDKSNADILLLQNTTIEEDTKKVLALKGELDNYVSLHSAQTALVYAIIAILILLFGVLFLVLRTFWSHRRHQHVLMAQNKMLEEERDKQKELNERLEEATQSKLVFFTNVSHDLRTPLTLIAEPVAQLKDATNLNDQQSRLVKIADKNVKILQRLINQILDFRTFENNKMTLNLIEVDFGKVVADWLESFQALAKKRDIRLVLKEPAEEMVTLAIDAEKIERVFFNLLYNAMKYSPNNSTITVSYEITDEKLVLKVADEGEGISRENLKEIFDRFYQVDKVRPRGSGIGLSLAKAFVELHEGSITVESELGKGSVFTVTLPLRHVSDTPSGFTKNLTSEDVEAVLDTVESEKEFTDDKPLLLVIDDNEDIREMVTTLMQAQYNVLTASNGKEGLKKASKYVPDIIICDVMMPGMDGMECCSRLKSETVTSHIPVLMLTACSLDEQRVQGFDSGADGYMAKPFSSAVLKSQAASLIANRKRIKDVLGSHKIIKETHKPEDNKHNHLAGDIDNEFYYRFLSFFEQKMADPNLNVETIAGEMGLERTQFYRKIKAITN